MGSVGLELESYNGSHLYSMVVLRIPGVMAHISFCLTFRTLQIVPFSLSPTVSGQVSMISPIRLLVTHIGKRPCT